MIQKLKKSNAGFTLVELLVVIAILGILAAVLVPQYISYIEKSRKQADIAILSEILHAADIAAADPNSQCTGTGTVTLTVNASTGVITFAEGTTSSGIADDLTDVCSGLKLQSKTGKALASTVSIAVSGNNADWSGGSAPIA